MNVQNQLNILMTLDRDDGECSCMKYHGFPNCIKKCSQNKLSPKRAGDGNRLASSQETLVWWEEKRTQDPKPRRRNTSCSPGYFVTRNKTAPAVMEDAGNSEKVELELVGKFMPTSPLPHTRKPKESREIPEQRIPQNTPVSDFINGKRSVRSATEESNLGINVAQILSYSIPPKTFGENLGDVRDHEHERKKEAQKCRTGKSTSCKLKRSVENMWRPEARKRRNLTTTRSLPNLRYFRKNQREEKDTETECVDRPLEGLLMCSRVRSGVPVYIDTQKIMEEIINGEGVDNEDCDDGDHEEESDESEDVGSYGEGCRVFMLRSTQGSIEEVFDKFPDHQKNKRESAKRSLTTTQEAPEVLTTPETDIKRDGFLARPVKHKALIRPLTLKLSSRAAQQNFVPSLLAHSIKINYTYNQ